MISLIWTFLRNINPRTWANFLSAFAILLAAQYGFHIFKNRYIEQGKAAIYQEWKIADAEREEKENDARIVEHNRQLAELAKMAEESKAIFQKQRDNNAKVATGHEKQIAKLQTVIADTNLKLAKSGGLRVPSSICDQHASDSAKATSDGNNDEGTTTSVLLPQRITENLLKLVDKCDEIVEQAREAQEWVKIHDLY